MRKSVWVRVLALGSVLAFAEVRPGIQPPSWAFPLPDKIQPRSEERSGPIQVPGSSKTFTAAEIDDLSNPPDWFPEEHGTVPEIVQHGPEGVAACGSCHLMSGHGHPQSADLAGLPVEYLVRQMADFKSGARKDLIGMTEIGKAISTEDARQAAEWFASLKPSGWVKVVETDTVPKSYVTLEERMRLPWPGTLKELIGKRIIELPDDVARSMNRDPHSGFTAYVPKGSIAKGEALVKTGGSGKTIACGICHGDSLEGIGDVPRLAGLHPTYIFRQLLYFYEGGAYTGTSSALMKKVVAKLTDDDMIAIAAYAASLNPTLP
jgi:cytochrome c553